VGFLILASLNVTNILDLPGYNINTWTTRPNMAVAITGAALRMACALGIHRETPLHASPEHAQKLDFQNDREVKRRTWWSLVCLDIWGSTTLGRPAACDYFGPAVTYVLYLSTSASLQ